MKRDLILKKVTNEISFQISILSTVLMNMFITVLADGKHPLTAEMFRRAT